MMGVPVGAGGVIGGAAARRAARDELSKPEYHRDDPGVLRRSTDWVSRHLDQLLSGSGGTHAVVLIALVLIAAAVVLAVRAGSPARRVRARTEAGVDPLAPVAARDHRRLAAELTAQGRHPEALREWLRAAVQTIEERGVLPPRPGRTGAATAREAGPFLPGAAPDLLAATTAFDEVWFGGRAANEDDVRRARAAADGVASARIAGAHGPGTVAANGIAAPW